MYAFCVWLQGFTNKICLLLKSIPLTLLCHLAPVLDSLVVIKKRVRWDVFSSYLYFHSNSSQHNLSYEGWHNETTRGREEGGGELLSTPEIEGVANEFFLPVWFSMGEINVYSLQWIYWVYTCQFTTYEYILGWGHWKYNFYLVPLYSIHLQSTHLFYTCIFYYRRLLLPQYIALTLRLIYLARKNLNIHQHNSDLQNREKKTVWSSCYFMVEKQEFSVSFISPVQATRHKVNNFN